jgi:predicted 3-demethylubiquinone-9 3-methyltransferase (glyoxalase superfamily)
MKKLKDNSFQENNTKENTQIRFNRTNPIQIQSKDQYQTEIITNTLAHKVKDRVADNHQ